MSRLLIAFAVLLAVGSPAHSASRRAPVGAATGQTQQRYVANSPQFPGSAVAGVAIGISHGIGPTSPAEGDCSATTAGSRCRVHAAATELSPYAQGAAGSVTRTIAAKLGDVVNAADFGALPGGKCQDVPINAALATGKTVIINPGTYGLCNPISITTTGQELRGAGPNATIFSVPNTFALASSGVIVCSSGEPGCVLRDFQVAFVQPVTSTRARLTAYPPAIDMKAQARSFVDRVRITNARTAIDARGNTGGTTFSNLEISSYDYALRLDGAIDSVRVLNPHFWPFAVSAANRAIYDDGANVGFDIGRADDFRVVGGLLINGGKQFNFYTSSSGTAFGSVMGTDLDTYANVTMNGGDITFSGCWFTLGSASTSVVNLTSGKLRIVDGNLQNARALSVPMIAIAANGANAYFQLANSVVSVTGDTTVFSMSASRAVATAIVSANQIIPPQNGTPANPLFATTSSNTRLTFTENRLVDKGTGAGVGLAIGSDDYHVIANNALIGWAMSLPGTRRTMIVANNN